MGGAGKQREEEAKASQKLCCSPGLCYANSPQAKGRIERAWKTFQDRLCSELRLYNISTLDAANHYLIEEFIPKYNRMFSRPAKKTGGLSYLRDL